MANDLASLAQIAATLYGIKHARRQKEKSQQQELLRYNQEFGLKQQEQRDRNRREEQDRQARERTARLGQIRASYAPLLQMGRTADEQAALSQTPGALEALRADQSDIANLIASGDDTAWENFRPRYYGGQGFMPPPALPTAAPLPFHGPFGMGLSSAPQVPAAPQQPLTDPLGNPFLRATPQAPQRRMMDPLGNVLPPGVTGVPQLPQPVGGADPLGNLLAATGAPPPAWLKGPLKPSQKTQAAITASEAAAGLAGSRKTDLEATRDLRIKKLQADIASALVKNDFTKANTLLTQLKQETEKQKPDLVEAQTAATKSLPGYRQGQLNLGAERNQITKRGQDIAAATAKANRSSRESIAQAARALKAGKVSDTARPFMARLAALGTTQQRTASGATKFLTPETRDAQAAAIEAEYERAYGKPLFGGSAPTEAPRENATGPVLTNEQRLQYIDRMIKSGVPKAEAIKRAARYQRG